MSDKFREVDALLSELFPSDRDSLRELFERKVKEIGVSPTAASGIMGMQLRAISKILDGTQTIIDVRILSRLANFLQVPRGRVIELYLDAVEKNYPTTTISAQKVDFIKENFDLAVLRKAGLIDNITNFEHIEQRLLFRLGLRSILEYRKPTNDVAFLVGPLQLKTQNDLTRAMWIRAAQACFAEIDNPYSYDRNALIKLFPSLRWYTTKEEKGLPEVIRLLYRIGITVVLQPPLPTLQLRGAVFNHNGKPCIVVTDYVGFYATLWFSLFHELHHVLFDWDEIKANKYHITGDDAQDLSVQEKEDEANAFASEYLFSDEKIEHVWPHINDHAYVEQFAAMHQVHPSIVYVQCTYAKSKSRNAWKLARHYSPDASKCIAKNGVPLTGERPIEELIRPLKQSLYY